MYKKTITYTDYNGEERTEDFYFNINKAEVMDMQLSVNGGYDEYLKKIIAEKDTAKLIAFFKELINRSYGEKSLDGKRFIKDPEITKAFTQTEAYSNYYVTLASDVDEATAFIKGVFPQSEDLDKAINKVKKEEIKNITSIENNA